MTDQQSQMLQDLIWRDHSRKLKAMRILRASMQRKGYLSEAQWQWLHFVQFAIHARPPLRISDL